MLIKRLSQRLPLARYGSTIEDFLKSQEKGKIRPSIQKPQDQPFPPPPPKAKKDDTKLFTLASSEAGITFQFAKLSHNLLIVKQDIPSITKAKEVISRQKMIQIYCDGASQQRV